VTAAITAAAAVAGHVEFILIRRREEAFPPGWVTSTSSQQPFSYACGQTVRCAGQQLGAGRTLDRQIHAAVVKLGGLVTQWSAVWALQAPTCDTNSSCT